MQTPLYVPIFRGKTFELRCLGQSLQLLRQHPILPVIEPVNRQRHKLGLLIEYSIRMGLPLGVIVNPSVGDFSETPEEWLDHVRPRLLGRSSLVPVIRTTQNAPIEELLAMAGHVALFHDGPSAASMPELRSIDPHRIIYQLVEADACPKSDWPSDSPRRALIRDGFIRRRNIDYPLDEPFPSFDAGKIGAWGDYSIAGKSYSEGGSLPNAVAIHVTYWTQGEGLRIRHYLSDTNDGPENPAGKFAEALAKLIADLDQGTLPVAETAAMREFRNLHASRHFPGLGLIKMLSMRHHLELIARRLPDRPSSSISSSAGR